MKKLLDEWLYKVVQKTLRDSGFHPWVKGRFDLDFFRVPCNEEATISLVKTSIPLETKVAEKHSIGWYWSNRS